jgi:hypothetical protein
VTFTSEATDLLSAEDTNGYGDVFVHDRDVRGDGTFDEAEDIKTVRVSVASDGSEADWGASFSRISSDGRFVVFLSQSTNLINDGTVEDGNVYICVHDRDADPEGPNGIFDEPGAISTAMVSFVFNDRSEDVESFHLSISSNGQFIAFNSDADDLVGDDGNDNWDVFVAPNPLFRAP